MPQSPKGDCGFFIRLQPTTGETNSSEFGTAQVKIEGYPESFLAAIRKSNS